MKRKYAWWLVVLIIVLPLAALAAANRTLLFEKPKMDFVELPAMKVVYFDYQGSYATTRSEFVRFVNAVRPAGIACDQLIGQYLDNTFVDPGQRRARIGCTVKEFPKNLPEGMKKLEIPAMRYIHSTRDENGDLINRKMAFFIARKALENRTRVNSNWLEMYGPIGPDNQKAEIYAGVDSEEEITGSAPASN